MAAACLEYCKVSIVFYCAEKILSDSAIRFVFHWDTTRENIEKITPTTTVARHIRQAVLAGEPLYEGLGVHWF